MTTAPVTIAYTPDSDDAFYYHALEVGHVSIPGIRPVFIRASMNALNQAALSGRHAVTAISSVLYPQIAHRYAILDVGSSVGRGYGPVLVSKRFRTLEDLRGRPVGVGGMTTTGWFLLRAICPDALPVEMPFDRIADAVAADDLDAGVMIHEELLYYPRLGLERVVDLGAHWCRSFELPLPIGLNVVRRDLGLAIMRQVCAGIRDSLCHSLANPQEALARVSNFGRGAEGQCTRRFVEMFANQDSVHLARDVREALHVLFCQVVDLGLGPEVPELDIIEAPAAAMEVRSWET